MAEKNVTPKAQLQTEQTIARPPVADWGIKLLRKLRLERLMTLGNRIEGP